MQDGNFTERDLVSFGEYLLSEKREQRIRQSSIENPDGPSYEDQKGYVHDADIQNWLHENKKDAEQK